MYHAPSPDHRFPSHEKTLSPEHEARRWFADFFAEEYKRFQEKGEVFQLPNERKLREQLDGKQLTSTSVPWRWFDVTNGCLQAFTSFVREQQNGKDTETLQRFLEQVDYAWLRFTPNILTEVSSSTALVCFGELMTMPSAQNTVLEHLFGEANYAISPRSEYSATEAKEFIEALAKTAETDERFLATLAYLPSLFRYAKTLSFSEERGTDFIKKTLRSWASSPERSILQKLVSSSVIEELEQRTTHDSPPIFEGAFIQTDRALSTRDQITRISRDAVGVLDRFQFLQEAGALRPDLTRPDVTRIQNLSKIEHALASARGSSLNGEYQLYQSIAPLRNVFSKSPDGATLLPFIDAAAALFEVEKRVRDAGTRAVHERDRRVQENSDLTDAQREEIYKEAEDLFQEDPAVLDLQAAKNTWRKLVAQGHADRQTRHKIIEEALDRAKRDSGASIIEAHSLSRQWPNVAPKTVQENVLILQMLHHPRTRAAIEKQAGCAYTDLSLREQLALGTWLLRTNEAHGAKTLSIIRRFGVDAARTFLACEGSLRHGEMILAFADSAPEQASRRVFRTFAEIADKLDLTAQSLARTLYQKEEQKTVDAETVRKELIRRGADVLLTAANELKHDPSGQTVLASLAKFQADTTLFASLFSSVAKQQRERITLEDVRDLSIEYTPLSALTDSDRSDLRALTDGQWAKKPSEELFPTNEDAYTFFLLRYQGRIAGFARFETLALDTQHINFFCMDERLRGSGIGEQLLQEMLERLSKTGPIVGEADPGATVASMYIERFGFVCTHIEHEQRESESLDWLALSLDRTLNQKLVSRRASEYVLRAWLDGYGDPPTNVRCERVKGAHAFCEKEAIALIKRYTRPPHTVMSRLLRRKEAGQEEWVLVFEHAL